MLHQLRGRLLSHLEVLLLQTGPLVTLTGHDLGGQRNAPVDLHVAALVLRLLVVLLLIAVLHVVLQVLVDHVAVGEDVVRLVLLRSHLVHLLLRLLQVVDFLLNHLRPLVQVRVVVRRRTVRLVVGLAAQLLVLVVGLRVVRVLVRELGVPLRGLVRILSH